MKNFKDISALHTVLSAVYAAGEGDVGRKFFTQALQEKFEFNLRQAELYASKVLSRNSNGSADWVSMNAYKVAGTWVKGDVKGSAGNLVVTKKETWQFSEDLTYEHKHESYEGYSSPFGASYSTPASSSEFGIWAPSDQLADEIQIVVIASTGWCRPLKIGWLGATESIPRSCSLDGVRFTRES